MKTATQTSVLIILSILILAILNYSIYEKEQIKKHGDTLLLELTPADPRSLMQGDYMLLRYTIANDAIKKGEKIPNTRYMVIRPDKNGVAQFVRFHHNKKLKENEKLLHFKVNKHSLIRITPSSFFFQEGYAKHYQNAKYGIFKFSNSNKYLLIGLADENRKKIATP